PGRERKTIGGKTKMAHNRNIKRLYRSDKEKIIGGVCGGIAEYFEADPLLVRVLWIILTLFSLGAGIIAYLIAWIIIPKRRK
ncbi:MAG: PspC domain-containing protein, partial [archaeon]